MKKLRLLFYYTSLGTTIGYLMGLLLFFNVAFDMVADQNLVIYVFTAFGFMMGLTFEKIGSKYAFFVTEAVVFLIALFSGKLTTILYMTKETLHLDVPAKKIKLAFIIAVVIINLINIYIIATRAKYQKVYTKEELKLLEETKLSDLREVNPEEEAKAKAERKKLRLVTIIGFAIFAVAYFAIPSFKTGLNQAFSTLAQFETQAVIDYLRGWGAWAAVVSAILMVLQSIAAPIPAFLITLSNAAIFGWVWGAVLSWSSAMAGAAVCFFIARALGRDVVEKLTSKGAMASVDVFFERYGDRAILICRLLPFVSFDFVSYGAGLTKMKFWPFFIATGVGQLPATIVYSYVGGTLSGGARSLFIGLMSLFALTIVVGIMKKIYNDKQNAKKKAVNVE